MQREENRNPAVKVRGGGVVRPQIGEVWAFRGLAHGVELVGEIKVESVSGGFVHGDTKADGVGLSVGFSSLLRRIR